MPSLPPTSPRGLLAARAEIERRLRARIRSDHLSWVTHALAPMGQAPARHHVLMCREIQGVLDGTVDRLMCILPPGSAKTSYITRLLPAIFFARYPHTSVISASHTVLYARKNSARVRGYIAADQARLGYGLATRGATEWRTTNGCSYLAAGVGTGIAGERCDLAIIDDPIKSKEEAESELARERVDDWYANDLVPRLKPGARVVLVQTRWHPMDLAGRRLRQMAEGGDRWRVLHLEAICEHPEVDPLGRAAGEALWPDWEPAEQLERKRTILGARNFNALYQGRPGEESGNLIKVADLPIVPPRRPLQHVPRVPTTWQEVYQQAEAERAAKLVLRWTPITVRGWDFAATEQTMESDPDQTYGIALDRAESGRLAFYDPVVLTEGPFAVEQAVMDTVKRDGPRVVQIIPLDPGAGGKSWGFAIARAVQRAGGTYFFVPQTKKKAIRAANLIAKIESKAVELWEMPGTRAAVEAFQAELCGFPLAPHDDALDAAANAYNAISENPRRSQKDAMVRAAAHMGR